MQSGENAPKATMAPHLAGVLAPLRSSERVSKTAAMGDYPALTKQLSEFLLASTTALAGAGEIEAACRLAGQACAALRYREPGAARRFDALLHRLTPMLTW